MPKAKIRDLKQAQGFVIENRGEVQAMFYYEPGQKTKMLRAVKQFKKSIEK